MQPHTISISYCKSYLLRGTGGHLLVDTGNDSKARKILSWLRTNNIAPNEIKLIVLSHSHFDHAYGLHTIKKITGARVLVHRTEADKLKNGMCSVPPGTYRLSKFIAQAGTIVYPNIMKYPGVEADILVDDELDLEPYGFDLKIIHSPGHTEGSISVVSKDQFAIVGDAMIGGYAGLYWPPFATDEPVLRDTWQKLLALNVPYYYAGHGRRIRQSALLKAFNSLAKHRV